MLGGVCAVVPLAAERPARAQAGAVLLEEVVSGGAEGSASVATAADATAVSDALYLAAVATRGFENTISLAGLGLQWTLLRQQCAGRNQTGISLWIGQGAPTGSGPVTAQLDAAATAAVISVARYSGADVIDPIRAVVSANTNGVDGVCELGVDTASYSVDLPTTSDGAQVFSAAAIRQRAHTAGADYEEIEEIHAGAFGGTAGLALQQRTAAAAGVVPVEGAVSDPVDWAVVAVEIAPFSVPVGPGDPPLYIWISDEELAALPASGEAFERVAAAADGDFGPPNVSALNKPHNTSTLAAAMMYVRTGGESYRAKVADAIMSIIGTEYTGCRTDECIDIGALAVTLGRNLACYAIAADLIDFNDYDPVREATFRAWLDAIRYQQWSDGSLVDEDEQRTNNHGRVAGASRVALALYLGDAVDLERAAQVFKGFLGDEAAYDGFSYNHDLSWQADESNPVGINPLGAIKAGHSIDGALPEEMRRGGPFQFPPVYTGYPWGALQGVVVEALLLARQGYDVWNWEDRAILRTVQFLNVLRIAHPQDPWWATGDDTWTPWLINWAYSTRFPTDPSIVPGKIMGFTDWTHAGISPVPALRPWGLLAAALSLVASGGLALRLRRPARGR